MAPRLFRQIISFFRDVHTISKSGIFAPLDYSKYYLGTEMLSRFAAIHYVLLGEKRGFLPNPFFDPIYFSNQSGGQTLAAYIHDQNLWTLKTSEYFDPVHYYSKYYQAFPTSTNPLLHFWTQGFGALFSPHDLFDIDFFVRAVLRDRSDKREAAYDLIASKAEFPLNGDELRSRQQAFRDQIVLDRLKLGPKEQNVLVFVQAGSAYDYGWACGERCFDLAINYYEMTGRPLAGVTYAFHQIGTKVTAVATLLRQMPGFFEQYDAVMLLDDDVGITKEQAHRLFEVMATNAIDLLQPSLTADSECFFPSLKQPAAGPGLVEMTAIEIMMPILSRRVFQTFGWVFEEAISGWLVDILLSTKVREAFGPSVWMLSSVGCEHNRPVDVHHGRFYAFLRQNGIDATAEAGRISIKYHINDKITAITPTGVVKNE